MALVCRPSRWKAWPDRSKPPRAAASDWDAASHGSWPRTREGRWSSPPAVTVDSRGFACAGANRDGGTMETKTNGRTHHGKNGHRAAASSRAPRRPAKPDAYTLHLERELTAALWRSREMATVVDHVIR